MCVKRSSDLLPFLVISKTTSGMRRNCHGFISRSKRFTIQTLVAMTTWAAWSAGETALT
jgi:hypothetical protein